MASYVIRNKGRGLSHADMKHREMPYSDEIMMGPHLFYTINKSPLSFLKHISNIVKDKEIERDNNYGWKEQKKKKRMYEYTLYFLTLFQKDSL